MRKMPNLTFIDTSVWIEYFGPGDRALCARVEELIRADRAVISGLVRGELLYGARSRDEYAGLSQAIEGVHCLIDSPDLFSEAAGFAWKLREKGIKIPLADLTIAAHCVRGGLGLVTKDRHFEMLEAGLGLRIRS